jgi:DNA-binding response OmpR family regulator
MTALKKKFSILVSEDHADYQFLYKMAVSEIDPDIEINLVYSSEQIVEFLIKDKLQRSLNRQVLPNIIILESNPPFKEVEDIKIIRNAPRFNKIPVVVFTDVLSKFAEAKAREAGANDVYAKPYTYHDLKAILQVIINRAPTRRLTRSLFCCRCDDYIEFDNEHGQFANQIHLSPSEVDFIKAKFQGPLCIPCLNQLKTSYRIINGDFNVTSQSLHKQ